MMGWSLAGCASDDRIEERSVVLGDPTLEAVLIEAPGDEEPADWAVVINQALAGAGETGTVLLPARPEPYEIRSVIRITQDGLMFLAEGATIRFADGAMGGEIVDCVEIAGTEEDLVEDVTIRGLTIDANYWAQPGSHNPRGIDCDFARRVSIESVRITNAFVGLTFGMGTVNCEAIDCVITNWFDDAFNASGDGVSGGCRGATFTRCIAEDAPAEVDGGPPGLRNNAWEIEDGAEDTLLIDCVVRNASGNGFAVRSHSWGDPVATSGTRFVGCRAENVAGLGWHALGNGSATTENVALEDCTSDSVVRLHKDIRGLSVTRCVFDAAVTLGPILHGSIESTEFNSLVRVWAQRAGGSEGAPYDTRISFSGCRLAGEPWILGDADLITFDGEPAAPMK